MRSEREKKDGWDDWINGDLRDDMKRIIRDVADYTGDLPTEKCEATLYSWL
jgi:hypothetical protein